jgi:hypothetical protein
MMDEIVRSESAADDVTTSELCSPEGEDVLVDLKHIQVMTTLYVHKAL